MKIINKYKAFAIAGLVVGFAFFALSVRISQREVPGAVNITLPNFQPVKDVLEAVRMGGTPVVLPGVPQRLVLGGPAPVAAAESSWGFVRQSATWANGNSTLADQLIVGLKNAGLITNSATQIQTTTVWSGVTYKVLLQTGSNCTTGCQNLSSTAYTGTKTFAGRFKMWRASDNKDVLELIFDDVNNPASGSGVLLSYRLAILSPTTSDNENLIVESYIFGGAPNRRQTYSWGQAFWLNGANAAVTSDRGRVVLEEMTVGLKGGGTQSGALCVRIAVRTNSITTGCGTGPHFYALAYGQKTQSNFETTALAGLDDNGMPASSTVCGLDSLKFGTFNGGGFLSDNLTSSAVPSGFPDPSVNGGYPGVQALFNKINTAGAGAGGYDDTQQATIVSLNPTFHPVSEAPGF